MSIVTWTETTPSNWRSSEMDNGLYGVIDRAQVGEDIGFWGYTALEGDIPAGPGETSEVYPDLDTAKDNVNRLLLEEWTETFSM